MSSERGLQALRKIPYTRKLTLELSKSNRKLLLGIVHLSHAAESLSEPFLGWD